jgi:hypothetical protein
MYKVSLAVPLLLLACALPHIWAQSASSPELPVGPMQAKATTACTECHDARIIVQQRLSKAAWTKEVDKMTKWGALLDPQDRDALIDYLSANFSVDKPEYVPERSRSSAAKKPIN